MSNRVVIVTGGSAGIGAALGHELSARGTQVMLVARREAELFAVARACGPNAQAMVADVSRREDVQRMVTDTMARFGQVDVLVNNVGRGISRVPTELTDEDIDEIMQVNVKSALYGMQAILPYFKARGTGHIINVSSMLGRMPLAVIRSAYCGAKHFLNALTASVRAEVQATHPDIQVSLVSPGIVTTDFGLNAMHGGPDSRSFAETQSAEEVAKVIADVIESRRADVYTRPGSKQRVLGYLDGLTQDP